MARMKSNKQQREVTYLLSRFTEVLKTEEKEIQKNPTYLGMLLLDYFHQAYEKGMEEEGKVIKRMTNEN